MFIKYHTISSKHRTVICWLLVITHISICYLPPPEHVQTLSLVQALWYPLVQVMWSQSAIALPDGQSSANVRATVEMYEMSWGESYSETYTDNVAEDPLYQSFSLIKSCIVHSVMYLKCNSRSGGQLTFESTTAIVLYN